MVGIRAKLRKLVPELSEIWLTIRHAPPEVRNILETCRKLITILGDLVNKEELNRDLLEARQLAHQLHHQVETLQMKYNNETVPDTVRSLVQELVSEAQDIVKSVEKVLNTLYKAKLSLEEAKQNLNELRTVIKKLWKVFKLSSKISNEVVKAGVVKLSTKQVLVTE